MAVKNKRQTQAKLRDFIPVLQLLSSKKVKPNVKFSLIDSPPIMDIVSQCACNALRGNLNLSTGTKKLCKKNFKLLKNLATKNVSHVRKKKLIKQSGGFFPLLAGLIPAALSVLGPAALGGLGAALAGKVVDQIL